MWLKRFKKLVVPGIAFVAGACLGLVAGFVIAWMLCARLLAVLLLVPMGTGGW